MRRLPTFDHSSTMIEAIRASAVRLVTEKRLSVNRQATLMNKFIGECTKQEVPVTVSNVSQQVWNQFAKPLSHHIPNNRGILELAWEWLVSEHREVLAEELYNRTTERHTTSTDFDRNNFCFSLMWRMLQDHASEKLTVSQLSGYNLLMLPSEAEERGVNIGSLNCGTAEQGYAAILRLRAYSKNHKTTEKLFHGTYLPYLGGLVLIAADVVFKRPIIITLSNLNTQNSSLYKGIMIQALDQGEMSICFCTLLIDHDLLQKRADIKKLTACVGGLEEAITEITEKGFLYI